MSDSEGDISDELLELAGATEKKRKKRQEQKPSSSKRRKAASLGLDSDQPESEDEYDANPYPLDGQYTDEADRQRLMKMSEIEREDILAQRLEERQRIQDKRNLDQMLKAQTSRPGDDSVSKAAKRQHAVRGATKEKSRKLDELKAKRRAKDEKKRTRTNSPRRDRSSSPMDMGSSDDEEEDGQITKFEEQEEKDRKLFDKVHPEEESITIDDLRKVHLTRNMLAKYCMAPWFEDYVQGAWVRYLVGVDDKGENAYRICEIKNLGAHLVKPYSLNTQLTDQLFELKHGASVKSFHMDKASNASFTQREFDRLVRAFQEDKLKLPTKRQLEKKSAQLVKLASQPMTESDITMILKRKQRMQVTEISGTSLTMEKSRLTQARTLAYRRQDYGEAEALSKQLELLAAKTSDRVPEETDGDVLSRVNERNRKANQDAVRKAELLEAERKRRERKLRAKGTATPPVDPSARPKTVPKLLHSRPATPATPGSQAETPRSVSPPASAPLTSQLKSSGLKNSFESTLLESVEIDLGDF